MGNPLLSLEFGLKKRGNQPDSLPGEWQTVQNPLFPKFWHFLIILVLQAIFAYWRYVLLASSRGGACFCTRGAMQGYAVIALFSRWKKPMTRGGVPGGSRGRPHRRPLNVPL